MDRATLYSTSEDLYSSLKRALKFIAGIDLLRFSERFHKNITVIYDMDKNEFDSWFWGKFRIKALSPLVVIGTEDKDLFINKHPVFSAYSDEHVYFQIPFDLKKMIFAIKKLKPIHDHNTRKYMVGDFSKGYEIRLITHDLKVIKGNKQSTMDNILKAKDFYYTKGDTKIVSFISRKIKEMQTKEHWEDTAFEIQRYLEERLKIRSSNFEKNTLH